MSKVLFDATALSSAHKYRGIGRYVSGIIQGFKELNLEEDINLLTLNNEVIQPFNCFNINRPTKPAVRFQWLLNFLFSKNEIENTKINIFHSNDFRNIPISKKFKTIVTAYDLIPLIYKNQYEATTSKDEMFGFFRYTLKNYKKAHHLIAISEATKKDFISYLGLDENKITVIYPAYDNSLFYKTDETSTILPRKKYFLYVGAHDYRKNIELQLFAYAKVSQSIEEDFVLVGKLRKDEEIQFKKLCEKLDISNRVVLLGYVSDKDLNILYNHATAFIFMTLYEGFGLPIIEAMAVGLPVISSKIEVIQEIADGVAILVDNNIDLVSSEMYRLSTDTNYRNFYAKKSIVHAQKFNWSRTAQRTYDLYQKIINNEK